MKVLIALLLILAVAFSFRTHHKMNTAFQTELEQCPEPDI